MPASCGRLLSRHVNFGSSNLVKLCYFCPLRTPAHCLAAFGKLVTGKRYIVVPIRFFPPCGPALGIHVLSVSGQLLWNLLLANMPKLACAAKQG